METRIKGLVFTKDNVFAPGTVTIQEDKISSVDGCALEELNQEEAKRYILPGLVDLHFHGCAGYDFCDGTQEAFEAIAAYENAHGITTICPATMTLSAERLAEICSAAAKSGIECLRGIYLEGPFISLEKKGAQNPAYIQKPNIELLDKLQECAGGMVRMVAIAPEEEGALSCIRACRDRFRFSIAHTCADYETAAAAIEEGARQVTHLYNAMPPFTHRKPGVIGAAADDDRVRAELICDGVHIHPAVVRSTFRMFGDDRIILISDSMMATGMEDGNYALGGLKVLVKGNLATLEDGTIAGSATNLYDCMTTAISMGVPKESAVKAATINPAKAIGVDDCVGSLEAGKIADILVTDDAFRLLEIWQGGKNTVKNTKN